MKALLLVFFLLFFVGCTESDSEENPTETPIDDNSSEPTTPQDPIVVEPEPLPSATQNPLYEQQWSINYDPTFYRRNGISTQANINMQDLLETYSGKGIRVAVIDDGFEASHPDMAQNVIATRSVSSTGEVSNGVSHIYSEDHHGTAVAGIIGAANNTIGIMGIASNVELILIQIPMEEYSDAATIRAFDLAQSLGADIINCSWGTGDVTDSLESAMRNVANNGRDGKGIFIVFASGNNDDLMYNDESAVDEVIAVAATDREGLRATYSDFGPDLDISAPGGDLLGITTLDPLGSAGSSYDEYLRYDEIQDGYETSFIGTSAAAPILSGALALALEADPTLTRKELLLELQYSATRIGENVPYMYDMISSDGSAPAVYGTFANSGYSDFQVRLKENSTNVVYGPYTINSLGNNEWVSYISDPVEEGTYTIEVYAQDSIGETIFATDKSYIIHSAYSNAFDNKLLRNDFYGYGKVDLFALIQKIKE